MYGSSDAGSSRGPCASEFESGSRNDSVDGRQWDALEPKHNSDAASSGFQLKTVAGKYTATWLQHTAHLPPKLLKIFSTFPAIPRDSFIISTPSDSYLMISYEEYSITPSTNFFALRMRSSLREESIRELKACSV